MSLGLDKIDGMLESGEVVVYYEQGTNSFYRVSEADVSRLGEMIRTNECDGDEYSHWCAATQAEKLGPDYLSEQDARDALPRLRSDAAEAGDLTMVAVCDRASAGDETALHECRRVLLNAEAQS